MSSIFLFYLLTYLGTLDTLHKRRSYFKVSLARLKKSWHFYQSARNVNKNGRGVPFVKEYKRRESLYFLELL